MDKIAESAIFPYSMSYLIKLHYNELPLHAKLKCKILSFGMKDRIGKKSRHILDKHFNKQVVFTFNTNFYFVYLFKLPKC